MGDAETRTPRLAIDGKSCRAGAQRRARQLGAGAADADRGRMARRQIQQRFEIDRRRPGQPRFVAAAQQAAAAGVRLDDAVVDELAGARGEAEADRRFLRIDREVERDRALFAAERERRRDGDARDIADIAERAFEARAW